MSVFQFVPQTEIGVYGCVCARVRVRVCVYDVGYQLRHQNLSVGCLATWDLRAFAKDLWKRGPVGNQNVF